MALVSLAVIDHFRHLPDRTETPMRVLVLPRVAGLTLVTILVLAIADVDVLTGASEGLAGGLAAVLAPRPRSEPEKYPQLGTNRL